MKSFINLIEKTNSDILGFIFFILLIVYFATKDNITVYEIY